MATQLEVNLQAILTEKNEKILPENIKEGITVFGVKGALKELAPKDTLQSISGDVTLCYDSTNDIAIREDWRTNQLLTSEIKNVLQYVKLPPYNGTLPALKIDKVHNGYLSMDRKYLVRIDTTNKLINVLDAKSEYDIRTYDYSNGALSSPTVRFIPGYLLALVRTGTGIYTIYKYGLDEYHESSTEVHYVPTYSASGYSNQLYPLSYCSNYGMYMLTYCWQSATEAKVVIHNLNVETMEVTEIYTENCTIDASTASSFKASLAVDNNNQLVYYRSRTNGGIKYASLKTIDPVTKTVISEITEKEITTIVSLANAAKMYATCHVYNTDTAVYWNNQIIDKATLTVTTNTTEAYPFNYDYDLKYAFSNVYENNLTVYNMTDDTSYTLKLPCIIYEASDSTTCVKTSFSPVPILLEDKLWFGTFGATRSCIMDLVSVEYCMANEATHMLVCAAASSVEYLNQYSFASMGDVDYTAEYAKYENLASIALSDTPLIDDPMINVSLSITEDSLVSVENEVLVIKEETE